MKEKEKERKQVKLNLHPSIINAFNDSYKNCIEKCVPLAVLIGSHF